MSEAVYIRVRLKYSNIQTFISEYAPRLTETGLLLLVHTPAAVGTFVHFELVLQNGQKAIAGQGEVSWLHPLPEQNAHGMIIDFISLEKTSEPILVKALAYKENAEANLLETARIQLKHLANDEIESSSFSSKKQLMESIAESEVIQTPPRFLGKSSAKIPVPIEANAPRNFSAAADEIEDDDSTTQNQQSLLIPSIDELSQTDEPTNDQFSQTDEPTNDQASRDKTTQYKLPESLLAPLNNPSYIRLYTLSLPKTPQAQDEELERLAEEADLASLDELVEWSRNIVRTLPKDPALIERELVALAVAAKKK